ncbi:RdgB/HAM1 family non-canonical purine NTP pyrophosphatase [Pseudomethylobacillus aquaticus]|uniref:dITP/XTP pyrophosphatase n=1 Tax=Pseudomethylobacillus aquaticus TaxID=2676064 RepID=A0A3N0V2Y1_9PROT|nr:RdgB/HAM1 family non-canonical purine NTP pyrophosphatase [Pseudomethylobacillus aquaticus]ROH86828.1 RdgB/HAM1 family non-canonical purine NTP pyrophosphatase [Pseudomethylobacillus aquaticus]
MLKQLVIATGNAGKLREFQQLLAPLAIEVIPQTTLGVTPADEPYMTFIENALTKARHASRHSGLPALADDSGICVDALQGAPGVHSARYAAPLPGLSQDQANNQQLVQALHGQQQRTAHYYCVLVLVRHADDPQPLIAEGVWQGEILEAPRGDGGFGYDPIFLDAMTGKTGAELPLEIKNRISHRGQALSRMLHLIERLEP